MTLNACGVSSETIAAELETDAVLREWGGSGLLGEFPPDDHYFWSAWRAEGELRTADLKAVADDRNKGAGAPLGVSPADGQTVAPGS